jgi:hypothetical protein
MTETTPTSTRPWTRVQDFAEVLFGAFVALSPLWVDATTKVTWTLVVLGALIALDGVWSLAAPKLMATEGIQAVLGVLLFISPFVMGYTGLTMAAWTSWIVGGLTLVIGGLTMQLVGSAHRHGRLTGQH